MGEANERPLKSAACVPERRSQTLLEISRLAVTYQSAGQVPVKALEEISIEIRKGESLAVLGESGSGKSTLALAILRLLPRRTATVRGTIRFQGVDILEAPERTLQKIRGARIAMVFQQPGMALNPIMRVGRQVAEVIQAHRPWTRSRCLEEAKLVLERVFGGECSRLWQAFPYQLSGGQRQRVSIAQALACDPQLIIADEPTASLDAVVEAGILEIFRELRCTSSVSLMLITHNPAILPGLADRMMVLRSGELVEEGALQDVYCHPRMAYTAELLRSLPAPWPQ
jgi:ABC-type microcin C transport system duplicated ATPase subunit YejF